LRGFFEVDAAHLVVAVLQQLSLDGRVKPSVVADAIAESGIDPEREAPFRV
jgi:pyruvate dehydrogenase E1 component